MDAKQRADRLVKKARLRSHIVISGSGDELHTEVIGGKRVFLVWPSLEDARKTAAQMGGAIALEELSLNDFVDGLLPFAADEGYAALLWPIAGEGSWCMLPNELKNFINGTEASHFVLTQNMIAKPKGVLP